METIALHTNTSCQSTSVSNIFIDEYMPSANGSFVKVYLYLLRLLSDEKSTNFSISKLADQFENTENDVIRALNYWEKLNLISVEKNEKEEIIGITVLEPGSTLSTIDEIAVSTAPVKMPATPVNNITTISPTDIPERIEYTKEQISALSEDEEVQWMLNIIEVYMDTLLKPDDVQFVLYLYDTLGFSSELIMHLYEYCIAKGKKSINYIEKVAINWAENNIDTVEKAEMFSTKYNTNINTVMKAFGLNRTPAPVEKQYIDKWSTIYGFDSSIMAEACSRTILSTKTPSFGYADKILEEWHKQGLFNLSDIMKADKEFNKSKAANSKNSSKKASNQFQSFPQREYSEDDFTSLERSLLGR